MQRFEELARNFTVEGLLKDHKKYLAHTPEESLCDHMGLVTVYFLKLVQVHGLEPLINRLLIKVCNLNERPASFAKRLFWEAILYHDFGKVNENFQRMKMGNLNHFAESKNNGIQAEHSILSTYIFLCHQLSKILQHEAEEGQEDSCTLMLLSFALGHNIMRHHSSRLDNLSDDDIFGKLTGICNGLEKYLNCYDREYSPQIVKNLSKLSRKVKFRKLGPEWFMLVRLNFSLLTAADYYATSHYCNKWRKSYEEFGVLNGNQKQRHFQNLKTSYEHNKQLYEALDFYRMQSIESLQEKLNNNLNKLRSKMAAEVIANTRKNASQRLFYIEAPTGGGKTNMAIIATIELLQANPELNKVFYVFPFTTLVTQTRKAAKKTLGLNEDEYIELHSRAAWKQKDLSEEKNDGLYGDDRLDDIHNQFVNYPYTFLSHVKFFDIIKTNDKSSIYLLHRLANSVVVIDEVQAYNPDLWDKMAYLLKEYAEALNIRFIVMSATLPKIGDLMKVDFQDLLPHAIERYFVNPNFANRVDFSEELLKRTRPSKEGREEYMQWLVQVIFERSEKYRYSNGQVRTIVEFIFKKTATEFAELAEQVFEDYEICVLSGTILEPRRRQIINALKNADNGRKNVLLVTTQVVEAGVDIDMDLGFKNRSIVDSEEQLAGRVNRHLNKNECIVYLFDLDDATRIYGKDRRYKEMTHGLEKDYFQILRTKRFDILYDKIKNWLKKTNEETQLAGTAAHYQTELMGQLNFPKIDQEFILIEQPTINVFVPLNLPLYIVDDNGEYEAVFTSPQLEFLENWGITPENDLLSGADIFELYKRLIMDRSEGFLYRKRNLQIMQSILCMFTFSLFAESKVVQTLVDRGNPELFGFLYLVTHQQVYTYDKGLDDKNFNELIFI